MLVLSKLCEEFKDEDLQHITTARVLPLLNLITEGEKQQIKKPDIPIYWPFSTLSKTISTRISRILAIRQC
jgi:hypothetical protein